MCEQPQPRFIVVGVSDAGRTIYQAERTSDRAVCGMDPSYDADYDAQDGEAAGRARVYLSPEYRQWAHAEHASGYITHLEDGTAGTGEDAMPVAWIPHQPFFTQADPRHED